MAAIPVTPVPTGSVDLTGKATLTGKAAVPAALMTGSAAENTAAKMAAIPVTATHTFRLRFLANNENAALNLARRSTTTVREGASERGRRVVDAGLALLDGVLAGLEAYRLRLVRRRREERVIPCDEHRLVVARRAVEAGRHEAPRADDERVDRTAPAPGTRPCVVALLERLDEVVAPPVGVGVDRLLRAGVDLDDLVRRRRHVDVVVVESGQRLLRRELRPEESRLVDVGDEVSGLENVAELEPEETFLLLRLGDGLLVILPDARREAAHALLADGVALRVLARRALKHVAVRVKRRARLAAPLRDHVAVCRHRRLGVCARDAAVVVRHDRGLGRLLRDVLLLVARGGGESDERERRRERRDRQCFSCLFHDVIPFFGYSPIERHHYRKSMLTAC